MGFDALFWLPIAVGVCAVAMLVTGIALLLRRQWAGEALADMRRHHAEDVDVDPQSRGGRSLMAASWIDFSRLFRSDGLSDTVGSHAGDGGGDGGGGGD